ncbi:MAG: protein translocase subunit SecD, partial [Pseudomonadota bacterium]
MLYFAPWKKALVLGLCLLGVVFATPNLWYDIADDAGQARREIAKLAEFGGTPDAELTARAEQWPSFAPVNVVNLGLDLRGGAHLLVEVNIEDVV